MTSNPEVQALKDQELLHAINENNLDGVRSALASGANANARLGLPDEHGVSALYLAASKGYVEISRALLEKDANPDFRYWFGTVYHGFMTPLGIAILEGHLEAVKLLLEYGANEHAVYQKEGMQVDSASSMAWHSRKQKELGDFFEERKKQGERAIQQRLEAGLPMAELEAIPVGSKFNIELTREEEETFSDELQGYHQYGEITIGENVYGFSNVATQESLQISGYEDQWKEAARRIVSGHDRTAFITNDGGAGWGTVFSGRWLMWREGEKVYLAPDNTPVDPYNHAGPYEGIESLVSKCSRGTADLLALDLQAIRDYLAS